ncbi:unnamed protein product [Brassicogethes aeneus]|uniref:DUF3668 domain-containing protein n=1 Tax=Brassicogethes aeneus TaxID=1431903 RepID=A0A9P0BK41_BRAAE|nr:unnamed protein product [Brassicogethes aeneus]
MNQLSGKFVNVVLAIEEGKGMDFLKYPVNILANFNGRVLESDKVEPGDFPAFNTELVWEVEKKDLRKIRTSNQPLRVECVTMDHLTRKERVGFTLLSLRSAMIIPLKDVKQPVPFHWQKLIGCQFDKKNFHPELYVSLTIRDHLLPNGTEVETTDLMPYISEEENDSVDELIDKSFAVNYLEDGYVQIGDPAIATKPFTFNLLVARAMNLDTLLPEVLVFRQSKEKYFMSFKIFGITIKTKPFYTELHEDIYLNEKIVVRILSSLDILKNFFAIQPITINFFCGRDKLGMTSIDLKNLITENNMDISIIPPKIQSLYYFKFPSPNGIVPKDVKMRSPYIEIDTTLRESVDSSRQVPRSPYSMPSQRKEVSFSEQGGSGDQKISGAEPLYNSLESIQTKSLDVTPKISSINEKDTLEINKKFVLEASIKSITWKMHIPTTKFIFKFLHPTTSVFITVFIEMDNALDEELFLTSLTVKMPYISTDKHIKQLLQMWKPKFAILDENDQAISKTNYFNTNVQYSEYVTSMVLMESAYSKDILAEVCLSVSLEEYDLEDIEESDLLLNPPVLDEMIFIKELGDLQKWKIEELDKFEAGLGDIKKKELKKLEDEYNEKKNDMQEQLEQQVDKCRKLQDDLTKKVEVMKLEKDLTRRRNENNTFEGIFQENWKKYLTADAKEIIEELSRAQRDNNYLRDIIEEKQFKLTNVEKNTLTKEQTTNLLQELKGLEQKFEEAQQTKKYFKDQWKKACDEIHELRTEDYKQLQSSIEISKQTLSELSLDKLLNDECCTNNTLNSDEAL